MTVADFAAAWVPLRAEPGDAIAVAVTVPSGSESGTWAATLWSDERRVTTLAAFVVSVAGQVVTVSLTSGTVANLMDAGSLRFTGHWDMTRTSGSAQRTWLKGDFTLDAGRTS
jgi:predicted phage tail protein